MPYNFEATFTQPLLAKLDNGLLADAEDFANAITKAYIATIKTGIPQGVPPSLPAPGLNPIAPPPFTIGASGIGKYAASREKAMYNIIYTYFLAKEISLDKASIDGLIQTIKQLINKIKTRQQQVKSIIEQIQLANQELKKLPTLLIDITTGIKEIIKEQTFNITNLELSFSATKQELGQEQFDRVFAKELRLINTLKNFNPTNIDGIKEIGLFISEYGTRTVDTLADIKNRPIKEYIQSKLISIAKEFLTLAEGLINPETLINYLRPLITVKPKVQIIYNIVQQYQTIKTILTPLLSKLEKQKTIIIQDIQLNLQNKLISLRTKVEQKITERNKKKENKAVSVFKKAKKKIEDFKKTNQNKITKLQKKTKLYTAATRSVNAIIIKSIQLIEGIPKELDDIKKEIIQQQKNVTDLPQIIDEQLEVKKTRDYVAFIGLSEFADQIALIIIQTKCSFQVFKNLFEKPRVRLIEYVLRANSIISEVDRLNKTIENIKKESNNKIAVNVLETPKKPSSLKDLIKRLLEYLRPKVEKLQVYIDRQVKETIQQAKLKAEKFKKDLEIYALTLLPVNSNVEDLTNKKLVAEAKQKKLIEKKYQVERIVKQTSFISKMGIGSKNLLDNLNKGAYRFSENDVYINKILDNYYSYKKIDQEKQKQAALELEKKGVKVEFEALKLIEVLIYGILETVREMQKTNFAKDLKSITTNTNTPGIETLKLIQNIIDNPPKTPKEVKDLANILGGAVLQDLSAANTILELERKYLIRSRQVIKTLCSIKDIKNESVVNRLNYIKDQLNKNGSFLLIAFKYLKEQLTAFGNFIKKKTTDIVDKLLTKLKLKKQKTEEKLEKDLKAIAKNKINPDAYAMSVAFGLGARAFWTGATWIGTTGSTHTTLNIGLFKPVKAEMTNGASGMIKEIAKGYEGQLNQMLGFITPPPNTLIPPIPFNGYK